MVMGVDTEGVMFLGFLVLLLGGGILPIVIFSTGEMVGLRGLAVDGRPAEASHWQRASAYGLALTRGYVWFGWAAYCAWLALSFAADVTVANPWVYYFTALLATSVPISYLHLRDRMSAVSEAERAGMQTATNVWRVLLLFWCLAFLLAPQLMRVPYGWFARVESSALGQAARGVTAEFGAAQRAAIPGSDYRLQIAEGETFSASPATSAAVTRGRLEGAKTPGTSAVAPCEQEPSDQRVPGREDADRTCADRADPECPTTDTPCPSTEAPERRANP